MTAPISYRSIVVGTDGSPTSKEAVRQAAALAAAAGGRLHLVYAFKESGMPAAAAMAAGGMTPPMAYEDFRVEADQVLHHASAAIDDVNVEVEHHARPGPAAGVILEVAEDVKADLIVVGNRGMSGARRVLGSVPNRVAHSAPCSVLIVDTSS